MLLLLCIKISASVTTTCYCDGFIKWKLYFVPSSCVVLLFQDVFVGQQLVSIKIALRVVKIFGKSVHISPAMKLFFSMGTTIVFSVSIDLRKILIFIGRNCEPAFVRFCILMEYVAANVFLYTFNIIWKLKTIEMVKTLHLL